MMHNQVNQKLGKPTITQDEFFSRYRAMADRGLPIPPSNPTAELSDAMLTEAWTRGAATTAATVAAVAVLGGLLWVSYRK